MTTSPLPFGITAKADGRYELPVTRSRCASTGNLHGGVSAAAAAALATHHLSRPTRVVSVLYHRPCPQDAIAELRIDVARDGKRWSSATVTGAVDGRLAFDARVLVGAPSQPSISALTMPDVPPPDACPARIMKPEHEGTFPATVDWRTAAVGPGLQTAWWSRLPGLPAPLAPIACSDILARGCEQVAPHAGAGISLDHTYRVIEDGPGDEWCLHVVDVLAITHDAVHGQIAVWSRDRRLLGIATQSCVAQP